MHRASVIFAELLVVHARFNFVFVSESKLQVYNVLCTSSIFASATTIIQGIHPAQHNTTTPCRDACPPESTTPNSSDTRRAAPPPHRNSPLTSSNSQRRAPLLIKLNRNLYLQLGLDLEAGGQPEAHERGNGVGLILAV